MPTPNESGGGPSSLDRFAAFIAPAIDRVFVSAMRYAGSRAGHLRDKWGNLPYGFLIDFRFVLPLRDVAPEAVAALSRYQRQDPYHSIRELAAAGMAEITADRCVRLADRGHAFLDDLFQLHSNAVEQLWRRQMAALPQLALLITKVLAAAWASGGVATRHMLPIYEPSGAPHGLLLLNRLGAVRYHRADAHVAAWTSAGLTAAEMVALPGGPRRDAIEAATNRGNAPAWQALSAYERTELLGGLAAMPGEALPD